MVPHTFVAISGSRGKYRLCLVGSSGNRLYRYKLLEGRRYIGTGVSIPISSASIICRVQATHVVNHVEAHDVVEIQHQLRHICEAALLDQVIPSRRSSHTTGSGDIMPSEWHASDLREDFTVVLQYLVSAALEEDFVADVQASKDPYFMHPLSRVDNLIAGLKTSLMASAAWKASFTEHVQLYPNLRTEASEAQSCQACVRHNKVATVLLVFSGQAYNAMTYRVEASREASSVSYHLGKTCADKAKMYHRLHHFLYTVYRACCREVEAQRQHMHDHAAIVEGILDQTTWVSAQFRLMEQLINAAEAYCNQG